MMDARNKIRQAALCLSLPKACPFSALEQVFAFYGPMPTGVTVTEHGRIFVCFPQWGDHPAYAVAELCGQRLIPYPANQTSQNPGYSQGCNFISVQSVVSDWNGGLWALDTGAPDFSPPLPGGAKLVKSAFILERPHRYTHFPTVWCSPQPT